MASIFKRKWLRPVPPGATIADTKRGKMAKWRDKRSRAMSAPLNDGGDRVVVEDGKYTIAYFDHNGKRHMATRGRGLQNWHWVYPL